jgi:hypothetical protein
VPTHQETKKMSDSDLPHADDDKCLRDFEVALMDTTKTVFEIMLNAGATPAQIDKLLASQQTAYEKNGAMPGAVFVMEGLRRFVRCRTRRASRTGPADSGGTTSWIGLNER